MKKSTDPPPLMAKGEAVSSRRITRLPIPRATVKHCRTVAALLCKVEKEFYRTNSPELVPAMLYQWPHYTISR